jgi:hypothetical protein
MACFPAGLLAHQGGWDEILFVAAPLVVLAALLGLANRRANATLKDGAAPDPDVADADDDESGDRG